jgi:hypothetical protein
MNECTILLCGARLAALPSGALWWPDQGLLAVADLHFGKAERIARRQGLLLPPWETAATLDRLALDLAATAARTVICLGDSFDDLAAGAALAAPDLLRLTALMAGRRWIWVMGNHDPGPVETGGTWQAEVQAGGFTFRHAALAGARAEVSGHYHPKLALPGTGGPRPCFLYDSSRVVLPAYGAYTGGLSARDPALAALFQPPAFAVLTGRQALRAPLR